MLLRRVTTFY